MENLKILYEDAQAVAVEKPQGIASQPAADDTIPDMVALLVERERTRGVESPYIAAVHRLDCNVGGAMVYAKTKPAAAALSEAFSARLTSKEYLAAVWGVPQETEGTLADWLYKDPQQNKVFCVERERRGVKRAELHYRVLETGEIGGHPVSLLSVTLGTGRSHQIRAQLSHIGLPIVGDGKYGGHRPNGMKPSVLALWSTSLTFPLKGKGVTVRSLPDTGSVPWSSFPSLENTENTNS